MEASHRLRRWPERALASPPPAPRSAPPAGVAARLTVLPSPPHPHTKQNTPTATEQSGVMAKAATSGPRRAKHSTRISHWQALSPEPSLPSCVLVLAVDVRRQAETHQLNRQATESLYINVPERSGKIREREKLENEARSE